MRGGLRHLPARAAGHTLYGQTRVAAVNGAPMGAGCEIAVACDFRIASERARFVEVWINLGCVPALGGMFLLPRIVGLAKATELVMTGEVIDAAEVLRIGLVNKVVMPQDLPRAAFELARRLARGPARALAAAKRPPHFTGA